MKTPERLKKGSKVAICTFSSPVPKHLTDRFKLCVGFLKSLGLDVIISDNVLSDLPVSKEQIACELNRFLADDTVSAVIPPWGGDIALEVLPLLNWPRLKDSQPKWIFGFSDVSTVCLAITTRLGWHTIHSANLMQLASNSNCDYVKSLIELLFCEQGGKLFSQTSSDYHEFDYPDYCSHPHAAYDLNTKSEILKINCEHDKIISGVLIGGCIDVLQLSFNTEFFNLKNLNTEQKHIVYIENAELNFSQYKRALISLKLKGLFDNCACILIGRNKFSYSNHLLNNEVGLLTDCFSDLDIPVIAQLDIGHVSPNFTLINGAVCEVSFDKNKIILMQSIL